MGTYMYTVPMHIHTYTHIYKVMYTHAHTYTHIDNTNTYTCLLVYTHIKIYKPRKVLRRASLHKWEGQDRATNQETPLGLVYQGQDHAWGSPMETSDHRLQRKADR